MKAIKLFALLAVIFVINNLRASGYAVPNYQSYNQEFLAETEDILRILPKNQLVHLLKSAFEAEAEDRYFYLRSIYELISNFSLSKLLPKQEEFITIQNKIYTLLYSSIGANIITDRLIGRYTYQALTEKVLALEQAVKISAKLKEYAVLKPARSWLHQIFPTAEMRQEDLIVRETINHSLNIETIYKTRVGQALLSNTPDLE